MPSPRFESQGRDLLRRVAGEIGGVIGLASSMGKVGGDPRSTYYVTPLAITDNGEIQEDFPTSTFPFGPFQVMVHRGADGLTAFCSRAGLTEIDEWCSTLWDLAWYQAEKGRIGLALPETAEKLFDFGEAEVLRLRAERLLRPQVTRIVDEVS